jgi:hypothetical protein
MLQLAKNNRAKFQFSSFYPEGFRQILGPFFKENFKIFQFCSFKWSILKVIFYQNLSRLAFLQKFQN